MKNGHIGPLPKSPMDGSKYRMGNCLMLSSSRVMAGLLPGSRPSIDGLRGYCRTRLIAGNVLAQTCGRQCLS